MTLDNEIIEKLIEKKEGESIGAYAAFLFFSKLPVSEREHSVSMPKVAAHTGLSEVTLKQYRQIYRWDERISLIDAHTWKLEYEQRQEILSEHNVKFVQENIEIKQEVHKATRRMLKVANNLLENAEMIDEVIETDHVITEDGRRVPTHTVIKMKAKISDIPRLVDTAVKASRLVEGLPTEIIQTPVGLKGDLSQLSDEEIDAQIEERRRQLAKETGAQKLGDIG